MGTPLIQASDVTTYASQINLGNPVDASMVNQLITQVSDMARRYCDRDWWLGAFQESFYGKNAPSVRPRMSPLVGVTSLVHANAAGNWQFSPVATDSLGNPYPQAAGYWFDYRKIYLGGGWRFKDSNTPNIFVVYSAGYASPTGGAGVGSFTITSLAPLTNQTPFSLPSSLTTIPAPGSSPAPTLVPSNSGGSLPNGLYYVVAVPVVWAAGFATLSSSLVGLGNSNGPSFNALLGPATQQAVAAIGSTTGSIVCSIPSPASGLVGYLWAIGASGGPYTVLGLSFGSPDYASVPADVKQACIKEVMFRYVESSRVGVKSSSEGNQQTAGYLTSPIDPEASFLLKTWHRTWGAGF